MSAHTLYATMQPSITHKRHQRSRAIRKMMHKEVVERKPKAKDNEQSSHARQSCDLRMQPARRVHFDFVGNGTDPRTRTELTTLVHELLENRKDCCLQRFCSKRECAIFFLYQLLVRNVDRRLQMMQCKLTNITLQYYDLRQHPITGHFFHLLRSDVCFSTTQQLFKWLDCEYRRLFGVGKWHECIEIKYEFEDQRYVIHHVTLVIIQLYLAKLDANSKRSLCRLLRNSPQPLDQYLKRGVGEERVMLINDCILAHFVGNEPWWIFFDVSQESGQITGDMLKLAHSAYTGLKEQNEKLMDDDDSAWVEMGNRLKGGGMSKKLTLANKSPKKSSTSQQHKIDVWIARFEKSFGNIFKALQQYYDCKYAEGVAQLCQNVCQRTKRVKSRDPSSADDDNEPHSDMQYYFNRYKLAQVALENLLHELEFCDYKDKLVPYLRRKSKELNDNANKYKVSKLKACKTQLAGAIADEITAMLRR